MRRRRAVAALSLVGVLAIGLSIQLLTGSRGLPPPRRLTLESGGQTLVGLTLAPFVIRGRLAPEALREAVIARLPATLDEPIGQARITADCPYGRWPTPTGKVVLVNFNEHAVVLSGLTPVGMVEVSNPLAGTGELWSKPEFEAAWSRLGRRALST